MIIKLTEQYISQVNDLLALFNYKINISNKNEFLNIYIYVDNSKVKGVIVFNLIYDRIEIEYIIVEEQYRNKGIATSLLDYISKINDIKNITLEVRKSNLSAIKLYEKNGFEIVAERKNYYKEEDGLLMIKRISD